MAKKIRRKESAIHVNLREFVNNIIEKNYAAARANLATVVNEKLKVRVITVLEENS
jgi:hypothetical protein